MHLRVVAEAQEPRRKGFQSGKTSQENMAVTLVACIWQPLMPMVRPLAALVIVGALLSHVGAVSVLFIGNSLSADLPSAITELAQSGGTVRITASGSIADGASLRTHCTDPARCAASLFSKLFLPSLV